jgi:hypothetical protein
LALSGGAARAADLFEIQVYDGTLDAPGETGLELHLNQTLRGQTTATGRREIPPDGVSRATLEPSIGLFPWLELGAYLQAFAAPDGVVRYGGWKLRSKLVVPASVGLPVRLGLNVELDRLPPQVDAARWSMELRPIVAWKAGAWLVVVNPILGIPLTGRDAGHPDLEPAVKVAWDTAHGVAVGIEYYGAVGRLDALDSLSAQSHLILAALDLVPLPGQAELPWELQVGMGGGLTGATPQRLVLKVIMGRSF